MALFGSNSNQQSGSGFGGFGSNNNSGTGFGQSGNTGFGASSGTTGGGLFGASNNNNNNANSGSSFGGFGAPSSTSTPFGATTSGFGANTTSGGGLFGSNTATAGTSSGFGGFGSNNANAGGGLFGGSKPAFGSQQPSTGGSLFGGSSNTFGSSNNQTTNTFSGAPISSALGSNSAECQGTGGTPFQPFTEKETATGNATSHFQSITFLQPYKNFSFEELRQADYNQGRRFGNGSGQAGAFGTSTGFGGFGGQNTTSGFGSSNNNNNQSTNLFGSQSTSNAPFGGTQPATSGFGSSNTGGLFGGGASKPGGLFGSTSSQPSGGGGLFGTANPSSGFGAQNNTNSGFGNNQSGGGGLFGTNNQQKSGFAFGGTSNNTNTGFGTSGTTGFGANNNSSTGGGLFGSNSTSTPFGGGQQQQSSNPFGGFGNNQQNQNQPQNNTGSTFGGFGNNNQQQQKPGGLFGTDNTTSNTGGGLFGNSNQNNQQSSSTGGGLFGAASNNQSGGSSLFGSKPATTGTGLFGSSNTTNTGNAGGGLFGTNNNQNQHNQSGGLFGSANNQQQQKPGGLFGNNTGGGLFGNNNNNSNQQQAGTSSLFGNLGSNNQQQQSGGLFGTSNNNSSSLFNNPQQQAQQQQQQPGVNSLQAPQAYNASIFDPNPYGNRSIFDGLPPPPQQYTGPVATPIGQKDKIKKGAVLPQYRINPHVASRFVTPQKRQGYGFSYSTYGTPSSASSNVSTPGGLGSSLLQGSISRSLGKSLSTTNLRRSFDTDQESLLSPNAFSAGSGRYGGTGSLKKLTIDRSLRTDLFLSPPAMPNPERNDQSKQPGILKKKVSFDASTVGGNGDGQNDTHMNGINGIGGNTAQEPQHQSSNSSLPNGTYAASESDGTPTQPEMEQVKGNELAVISEDSNTDSQPVDGSQKTLPPSQYDPKPGAYYMKPSREEISKMSSDQKKKVSNYCIGREGCGFVVFDVPVNLQEVDLDRIFGEIALIELRSLTVYPASVRKPARGKGLNVPSTIHLANSWPRARDHQTPLYEKSGPRYQKHLIRLKRVRDTEFVDYNKDTGTWIFKVKHFTTYALDYDDEGMDDDTFQSSTLSAPPDSLTPQSRLPRAGSTPMPAGSYQDSSIISSEWSQESSGPDDTFQFRRNRPLPGAFDDSVVFDEESERVPEMEEVNGKNRSFHNGNLPGSKSDDEGHNDSADMSYESEEKLLAAPEAELDMVGSFPQLDGNSEQGNVMPKSILKTIQPAMSLGTPRMKEFNENGDWAQELRRTISPRKQDRQALRGSQARVLQPDNAKNDTTPKASVRQNGTKPGFASTMDLMNSIFPQEHGRRKNGRAGAAGQGEAFQYPYPRTLPSNGKDEDSMSNDERQWHDSFKPSFGPGSTLLHAQSALVAPSKSKSVVCNSRFKIVSEGRDVYLARFANTPSLTPRSLSLQKTRTRIVLQNGIPFAVPEPIPLKEMASSIDPTYRHEKSIWNLASILFDDLDPDAFGNIPSSQHSLYAYRVRKDHLSSFWSSICTDNAQKAVASAPSAEERSIHHLSANFLVKACQTLTEAKDFRLATLVAQLPADQIMADEMKTQLNEWRELCVLSEFIEPIRTLYELCAGNVCVSEGKKGAIEDQAKTFAISQRFDLDWQRAFGLRLWYGTKAGEPIEAAIKMFHDDIHGDEPKKPTPMFTDDVPQHPQPSNSTTSDKDILWGLLELFAASHNALPAQSLTDIVTPHNVVGNPLNFRLSFQLYHTLSHLFPMNTSQTEADHLVHSFASQLESQGEWLWSIFVSLHLSNGETRQKNIQDILGCHAPSIGPEESSFPFTNLVHDFKIPTSWIWEAKALEARSVMHDFALEILYLQRAGNWVEAHESLVKVVGPQCVIGEDYQTLNKMLEGFQGAGKQVVEAEDKWHLGGGIYKDFLQLVISKKRQENVEEAAEMLLDTLPMLVDERKGKFGFEEGVAVREMAGEVAEWLAGRGVSFLSTRDDYEYLN
ncbi:MAG: hypothetical protein Q9222_004242 [Ikaeria aurantiellina]